jgi:hypothetical protein
MKKRRRVEGVGRVGRERESRTVFKGISNIRLHFNESDLMLSPSPTEITSIYCAGVRKFE